MRWDALYVDHAARMDLGMNGLVTVGDVAKLTLEQLGNYPEPPPPFSGKSPRVRRRGLLSILAVLAELGVPLADGTFLRMPIGTDLTSLHSVPTGRPEA